MAGAIVSLETSLSIERGTDVPDHSLTMAGKVRRRLLRGESLTTQQAVDEIGGSPSFLGVTIGEMQRLGFEIVTEDEGEGRDRRKRYRLADPGYQPTPADFEARLADNRKRGASGRPSGDWLTAAEVAEYFDGSPDRAGKLYRSGRLTRRRPRLKGAKGFYYDRAEVEAIAGERQPAPAVEIDDEPVILPPSAEVVMYYLAEHGTITDPSGMAGTGLRDRFEDLGYTRTTSGYGTKAAEGAGLIERDTQGKRTYRIALTDRGRAWVAAHPAPDPEPEPGPPVAVAPPSSQQFPAGRESGPAHLPTLPGLGDGVTVFALVQDRDGTITMGLRNGATSWQVEVIGATRE